MLSRRKSARKNSIQRYTNDIQEFLGSSAAAKAFEYKRCCALLWRSWSFWTGKSWRRRKRFCPGEVASMEGRVQGSVDVVVRARRRKFKEVENVLHLNNLPLRLR